MLRMGLLLSAFHYINQPFVSSSAVLSPMFIALYEWSACGLTFEAASRAFLHKMQIYTCGERKVDQFLGVPIKNSTEQTRFISRFPSTRVRPLYPNAINPSIYPPRLISSTPKIVCLHTAAVNKVGTRCCQGGKRL